MFQRPVRSTVVSREELPWRPSMKPKDEHQHGVSCRSWGAARSSERAGEREGVSFKLEIASSAAMMGRKLGAKQNAKTKSVRVCH